MGTIARGDGASAALVELGDIRPLSAISTVNLRRIFSVFHTLRFRDARTCRPIRTRLIPISSGVLYYRRSKCKAALMVIHGAVNSRPVYHAKASHRERQSLQRFII